MRTAVDTNILARALLNDDVDQSPRAHEFLFGAGTITVSIVVFAELVWVLRTKRVPLNRIVEMLEALASTTKVETDGIRFEAGLAFMKRGGDFADGVALHDARQAKSIPLRTFDKKFAKLGAPDVVLVS